MTFCFLFILGPDLGLSTTDLGTVLMNGLDVISLISDGKIINILLHKTVEKREIKRMNYRTSGVCL